MSEIVSLNKARKAKARLDKARLADANRAKFGRTKAQRLADEQDVEKRSALLTGAFRERRQDEGAVDQDGE
ncbi:DUF4169 family protein [Sphingobium sp.]|uniref:DUF4169 family protein n=1 Tax=Sphingobium sp. TaxID=1912891 RepID=UPI003BB67AA1